VWLWLHAASAADAWAALHAAWGQGQALQVAITSLCSSLRRVELRGARVMPVLAQLLGSAQRAGSGSCAGVAAQAEAGQQLQAAAAGQVLALTVRDPRLARPLRLGQDPGAGEGPGDAAQGPEAAGADAQLLEGAAPVAQGVSGMPGVAAAPGAAAASAAGCGGPAPSPLLAVARQALPAPLTEPQVAAARQLQRLAALHLPQQSGRQPRPQQQSPYGITSQQHDRPTGQDCPLMLVRQAHGCSLVLPSGWVMPFWQALALQGGRQLLLRVVVVVGALHDSAAPP
jgi:hypothetical protein